MKWRLMLAAAVFVIFGIPLMVINLGALGLQAKFENEMSGQSAVPDPIADAGGRVIDIWGDFREGREIDALFVEDRFTRRRSITYTETLSIADLLNEGEARPDPEFERLWVLARASRRALEKECPVVLETIGRACAVSSAKVDETSEDGVFKIEAIVGYLPDHALGDTTVEGPRDLYRARLRLPAEGGIAVPPEGRDAAKRTLYQEIERACDRSREQRGNCVIADLELREGRMNGDGRIPYHVTASLYSVGPKGSRGEDEDLVGTYGATFAENPSGVEQKLGLFAALGALFNGGGDGPRGEGPSILRGGHQRYVGNDGKFIPAPKP